MPHKDKRTVKTVTSSRRKTRTVARRKTRGTVEPVTKTTYDDSEQDVLLREFLRMLKGVTKDGGRKRAKGEKPPWWRDDKHIPAIFSHLNKYFHGEKIDADSGE